MRIGRVADVESVAATRGRRGRHPALRVEDVRRDRRSRFGGLGRHAILRGWERCASRSVTCTLAPAGTRRPRRPIEAIRRMLPIDSKLIHCRWTGESTWIPFGDFRPGLDYENHTSHPAPGSSRSTRAASASARSSSRTAARPRHRRWASWRPTCSPRSCPTTAGRTACARSAGAVSGRARSRSDQRGRVTDLLIRGGTVVTATGSRRADVAVRGGGHRGDRAGPERSGGGRRRGHRCDRAAGAPRRGRRPHPHACRVDARARTGSSRTPWRPRSVARRRSWPSTTRARDRRPPRSGRCGPGSASGARPPTATARSTSG